MKTKSIIVCLLLLFATQAVTAQNNAEVILRQLVDQIKSHKNVEMSFSYQTNSDGKNIGDPQIGHAWLEGESYKIEMAEQQTISNGTLIWSYLVDDDEVMISNTTEGNDNTPLKLLTSLDESYVASLTGIDAQSLATIELANPKGQYKRVTLQVNTKKTELKSVDIYLEDGSKIAVTVEEMRYDQNLGKDFFRFDAKAHPNVEIIDMR